MVDPDMAHLISQKLMAVGFVVACLTAMRIRRFGYALFYLLALFDTYARLRYPLHVVVRDAILGPLARTPAKLQLQNELLLATIAAGAIVAAFLVWTALKAPIGQTLMAIAMFTVLGMLAMELISPHWLDTIIYRVEGPFILSSIIYFLGATLSTIGAFAKQGRKPRAEQVNPYVSDRSADSPSP